MYSQSWPSTSAPVRPPSKTSLSARASAMYGARSTRFCPAHQAQIAAPKGYSCLTNAIAAITGTRNCSSDPPSTVMNRPNGEKMMCPAS